MRWVGQIDQLVFPTQDPPDEDNSDKNVLGDTMDEDYNIDVANNSINDYSEENGPEKYTNDESELSDGPDSVTHEEIDSKLLKSAVIPGSTARELSPSKKNPLGYRNVSILKGNDDP